MNNKVQEVEEVDMNAWPYKSIPMNKIQQWQLEWRDKKWEKDAKEFNKKKGIK